MQNAPKLYLNFRERENNPMKILFLMLALLFSACSSTPVREVTSTPTATTAGTLNADEIQSTLKEENPTAKQLKERGLSHFLSSDYPKAIQQLETSFLLAPESEETKSKFHLYYAYLATGEYKKALSTAESLVSHYPYLSLSYQQLGLAHYFLGDTTEAQQAFQKASEFDAHSPRLHFYMGLVHDKLNQPEQKEKAFLSAEKEYRQILKSNEDDLTANYELASLFLFWNKNTKEVPSLIHHAKNILNSDKADLTEEAKKTFHDFYFPLLEGIYAYRQSDAQLAIELLLSAFSNAPSGIKPDLAETYYYLGLSHQMIGEKDKAKALLEQSLTLDPRGPMATEASKTIRALSKK